MSVSQALSEQIVNRAWSEAETLLGDLDWRLDHAETAVSGTISVGTKVTTPLSAIIEPTVNIPLEAEGPDLTVFNEFNNAIKGDLVNLFADFLSDYFPLDAATLSIAETKIQQLITDGGSGVNTGVEAQIWERDRARILADETRALEEAEAYWSGKRFPIPPGALQYQVSRIQQQTQDELAKASSTIAVKTYETEVEMLKFAIESALKLRQIAVTAAGDYIKAIASSQHVSYQMAMGKAQAQNNLISAVASYYNARTNAKDTVFKSNLLTDEVYNKANIEQAKIAGNLVAKRAEIAVAAAETVGKSAAAMLNNLHTSIGVQGKEDI